MSSARLPGHGGATALGIPAAPHAAAVFDSRPAALPEPPLAAHPPHLAPCAHCAALNGRSALVCWSCEADLLAPPPQPAALPPRADSVVPVVHEVVVAGREGMADGRRGLHLVSRTGEPASVLPVPEPVEPAFEIELPVLTSEIHGPTVSASASIEPGFRLRLPPPLLALALAAGVLVLVLVAAGLRSHAPSPAARPPLTTIAATAALPDTAFDRPFAAPSADDARDAVRLSFPAVEVAPDLSISNRPERAPARSKAGASARPAVRTRATAPAPCTSNMAALGFCTLEPPSGKE